MTASDWIDSVIRDMTNFAREAIKRPIAAVFSLAFFSFGLYVMALLAWLFVLFVASLFGFYPEEQVREAKRENLELALFLRPHREAFCTQERIPMPYCEEIFNKSAAFDYAIHLWVQQKMAEDKLQKDASPYWGLFQPFKLPTSRR